MNPHNLKNLMDQVAQGEVSPDEAMGQLKNLPFEDLGFAKVDHHRSFRKGFPEVIYGEGKTPEQILSIARAITRPGLQRAGDPGGPPKGPRGAGRFFGTGLP